MDKEIKELRKQRDLAESRIESMLQSGVEDQVSTSDEYLRSEGSKSMIGVTTDNRINHQQQLSHTAKYSSIPKCIGFNSSQGWEEIAQEYYAKNEDDICKEVRCIEMDDSRVDQNAALPFALPISKERGGNSIMNEENELSDKPGKSVMQEEKESTPIVTDFSYDALKLKIQEMQRTINSLANLYPFEDSPCSSEACMSSSKSLILTRSKSCKAVLTTSPSSVWLNGVEQNEKDFPRVAPSFWWNSCRSVHGANFGKLSRKDSHFSNLSASFETEDTEEFEAEETVGKESPRRANGFKHNLRRSNHGRHITKLSRNDSRASVLSSPLGIEQTKEIDLENSSEKDLRRKLFKSKYGAKTANLSRRQSRASVLSAPVERYDSKESDSEDTVSVLNFVAEHNTPEYENQYIDNLVSPQSLSYYVGILL